MAEASDRKAARSHLQALAFLAPWLELYDDMLGEVDGVRVLQQTTAVVGEVFGAERATVYRVLKETQELEPAAVIGNVARTIRVPIREDSLAGYCALTGRCLVVPDAYGDLSDVEPELRFDPSCDQLNRFRTRDVMWAPASCKADVLGVVQVINSTDARFQERDLLPLESISRFVAYALYHARLYDELETLKGLEKEKAEFTRIIVHELRSPVAASKSLISALQYMNRGKSELISVRGRAESRMDELLDLVQDVPCLSQVKAGRPLGEIVVCDLVEETQQVYGRYVEEGEAKGLSMSVRLPDTPVSVRIDRQAFSLILSNLISNAVKYTPSGSVRVRLMQEDAWAAIEVEDAGMGIPADEIPALFAEFFRASNARGSEINGTGVGLAGVNERVDRFGGQIELTSEVDEGSTFLVRLSLYDPAPALV